MAQSKDFTQIIKNHINQFNTQDWNNYKALFAAEGVYEEEATHAKVTGPDRIIDLIKKWTLAFPDLKGTVKEVFVSGDKAVCEILWRGTQKAELNLPVGRIPVTNRAGNLPAMVVYEFDHDGKIVNMRHYFDIMTLLSQLGVQPQLGAQASPR